MKKVLIVDDVKGWRDYNSQIVDEIFNSDVEIYTADCAQKAYDLIVENNEAHFDYVITDLQMENDFEPKYAGEWLVEQVQLLKNYKNTKIILISATYNIRAIATGYNVECIPKSTALKCFSTYQDLLK